jgi:hypothetical protein
MVDQPAVPSLIRSPDLIKQDAFVLVGLMIIKISFFSKEAVADRGAHIAVDNIAQL